MEEMKMIVEALSNLGDGAKMAFITWVLIKYALSYLLDTVIVGIIALTIYKILSPLFKNLQFISRIKTVMKYYEEEISSEHKNEVLDILQNHQDS